jgi:uncharacterized protein (DUF302 family)
MPDSIDYPLYGRAAALFQRVRFCPATFSEAVIALRETIDVAGLRMVDEIDTHFLLQQGDYRISFAHMFIVVDPAMLARIVDVDPSALLEMPLKFVVLQRSSGAVIIRWLDPSILFARYGNPALDKVGKELAATSAAIADAAIGSLTGPTQDAQSANLFNNRLLQPEPDGAFWL